MTTTRPRFEPSHVFSSENVLDGTWTPLVSCPANFPLEIFETALSQLIHHPEYNSTLILRSEVIHEASSNFPRQIPSFADLTQLRYIHRKLLPRRPGRDPPLEQYCTLYGPSALEEPPVDTLILTPIFGADRTLPYYHPSVSHLAFRYIASDPPTLRIEALPLPGTPTDPNSRLYRTCLSLLETLHRYGWGAMTNYKKRVQHDCLVPRDVYQDLYLVMRERYKHLVDTWQEVTDPLKHVFEDIGIATFLMLLWKDTFSQSTIDASEEDPDEPWKSWPRPPGGFLDFGCGNGLLTHILISSGYPGSGIDLRARTSWAHYPPATQRALHVHPFNPISTPSDDPTTLPSDPISTTLPSDPLMTSSHLKPGIFIIGNHADELTPWIPVMASKYDASGYLSIPCCAWGLDGRFERGEMASFGVPVPRPNPNPNPKLNESPTKASPSEVERTTPPPTENFIDSLNLGADGTHKSSYSKYRIWLASLSLYCGWEVECEVLRIPSTRNWGLVGRKRTSLGKAEANERVQAIIEDVRRRGVFKTRKPEGKGGGH